MRAIAKMDTVQIELTSACVLQCSNCTRFCGHHKKNFYLTEEQFKKAVDVTKDHPKMVGIMGGEPLLHPKFEEFCDYALSQIPRERLGLWSVFPKGLEKYREVICRTFGNIFLNDHTRDDVEHGPILVGIEEVVKDEADLWRLVDDCWVQNSWSASINPKGAFFCEVAAAMSYLFDGPEGWPVEEGWWKRTPKDYKEQMETWCKQCGCALPLARRMSVEETDDVSPKNLERLKKVESRKVKDNLYKISDQKMDTQVAQRGMYPVQVYKEWEFRQGIAARYGIFLSLNAGGFMEPHLKTGDWQNQKVEIPVKKPSLFEIYKEEKDYFDLREGKAKNTSLSSSSSSPSSVVSEMTGKCDRAHMGTLLG